MATKLTNKQTDELPAGLERRKGRDQAKRGRGNERAAAAAGAEAYQHSWR